MSRARKAGEMRAWPLGSSKLRHQFRSNRAWNAVAAVQAPRQRRGETAPSIAAASRGHSFFGLQTTFDRAMSPATAASSCACCPNGLRTTATTGKASPGRGENEASTVADRLRKHRMPATLAPWLSMSATSFAVVEKLLHTSSTMNQLCPGSGSCRLKTSPDVSRDVADAGAVTVFSG